MISNNFRAACYLTPEQGRDSYSDSSPITPLFNLNIYSEMLLNTSFGDGLGFEFSNFLILFKYLLLVLIYVLKLIIFFVVNHNEKYRTIEEEC